MSPLDFEYLRRLLKERSGLVLTPDKQYLLESRLLPIARRRGAPTLAALIHKLRGSGAEGLIVEVVEAMTTNETFFFRDKLPFEHFREAVLPRLLQARAAERRISIWCAAASSGQEPYSLAMMLKDLGLTGWRIDILATDLSAEMVERTRAGTYSQFEVQRGLPIQSLVKHFTQAGDVWQIAPAVRAMVDVRQLNLLHPFAYLGPFDIVFCRNVLIYFDQATKSDVLTRIGGVTAPDGYLVLGSAETVVGLSEAFKPHEERRGLYCRRGPSHAAPRRAVAALV